MRDQKYTVVFTDFERRAILNALMETRNRYIKEDKPTEDINEILEKLLDAKAKRVAQECDRDER